MKVDNFSPLVEAISQLSQVFKEGDVRFIPSVLSIIASNHSIGFIITLHIKAQYFTEFTISQNRSWRISLQSLHQTMFAARNSSKMIIRLPPIATTTINPKLTLTFSSSRYLQPLVREVNLSPPEEGDVESVTFENYFAISSEDLKLVIIELSLLDDASVFVTLTNSEVKLSVAAAHEIILTTEDGRCEIVGYEGEFQIQFQISLYPKDLILNLIKDTQRIYFSKTNSYAVITVPTFKSFAQYMLYFPQMEYFDV